jgi:WD40 repeat protein
MRGVRRGLGLAALLAALGAATFLPFPDKAPTHGLTMQAEPEEPVRFDRYGDPLPWGALVRLGSVRYRYDARVECLGFSRDRKRLAVGTRQSAVVWDVDTGAEVRKFTLQGTPHCAAFTLDGKAVAFAESEYLLALWDLRTGREIYRLRPPEGLITSCAFSPDGRLLATDGGWRDSKAVYLWDAHTGARILEMRLADEWVDQLAFTADGRFLVGVAGHKDVVVWDVAEAREVQRLAGAGWSLALAPDGRTAAVGKEREPVVGVWDLLAGELLQEHRLHEDHGVEVRVAVSPDGAVLAAGDTNDVIHLWDLASGTERRQLEHGHILTALAFSPDGQLLGSGGWESFASSVKLWDAATGERIIRTGGHHNMVEAVAFSWDGRRVVTTGWDRAVRVWDPATGEEICRCEGEHVLTKVVVFSPDGTLVAAGGGANYVCLWEAATGREMRHLAGQDDGVRALGFSLDGRTLISAWGNGLVLRQETDTGKELGRLRVHDGPRFSAAISPDGRLLALVDRQDWISDHVVRVWDLMSGTAFRNFDLGEEELEQAGIEGEHRRSRWYFQHGLKVAFSPDGKTLAASRMEVGRGTDHVIGGHSVRLWDIASGQAVLGFDPDGARDEHDVRLPPGGDRGSGRRGWTTAGGADGLAFSPDGRFLVTGQRGAYNSNEIRTVAVRDLATGKELGEFWGHRAPINGVTFSPDGRFLASGSDDHTALLWNATLLDAGRADMHPDTSPGELDTLWSDLIGFDAVQAHRALQRLVAVPDKAVPFVRDRLRLTPPATQPAIDRWIAELDSEEFTVRQRATDALRTQEGVAEPALRRALSEKPPPEARRRIEGLLEGLENPFSPAARLALRGTAVLERIGSPPARAVLEELAVGPLGMRLPREAAASLARLKHRPLPPP